MANIYSQGGLLNQNTKYTILKKIGIMGDTIPKHYHPEAMVLVTVVKGKIQVNVDGVEHKLTAGDLLEFDGNNSIEAKFISDGEFFVTLIMK